MVWASATTKEDEAVAKQRATAMPGTPMSRKSFSVPRPPSRTSMKPMQEDRRPEGTPEDDRPAVRRLDEARDGAAEAPEEGREEDEQEAEALFAAARHAAVLSDVAVASVMAPLSAISRRQAMRAERRGSSEIA